MLSRGIVLTETLDINLIVTAGAVLLAVLSALFAFRASLGGDGSAKGWKNKCAELDRQIAVSYTHLTLPTKA